MGVICEIRVGEGGRLPRRGGFSDEEVVEELSPSLLSLPSPTNVHNKRTPSCIHSFSPALQTSTTLWSRIKKKLRKNSHLIFYFSTSSGVSEVSKPSGARKRSKQCGASEGLSSASEQVNGRASGPVLQSLFLTVINHSDGSIS